MFPRGGCKGRPTKGNTLSARSYSEYSRGWGPKYFGAIGHFFRTFSVPPESLVAIPRRMPAFTDNLVHRVKHKSNLAVKLFSELSVIAAPVPSETVIFRRGAINTAMLNTPEPRGSRAQRILPRFFRNDLLLLPTGKGELNPIDRRHCRPEGVGLLHRGEGLPVAAGSYAEASDRLFEGERTEGYHVNGQRDASKTGEKEKTCRGICLLSSLSRDRILLAHTIPSLCCVFVVGPWKD